MHSYLRAIGFSKLEQKDLDQILQEVIVSCDEKKIAEQGVLETAKELTGIKNPAVLAQIVKEYDTIADEIK